MPPAAMVNQRIQVAGQTAFGATATTGFRRLKSMGMRPMSRAEVQLFRAMGERFNGVSVMNDEWSGIAIDGIPDFNELIFPFSAALGTVTPVRITATTGLAYRWTWTFAAGATRKALTIEQGGDGLVTRTADVVVDSFGLEFTKTAATITGGGFGNRLEDETVDGRTYTAGATDIPQLPVSSRYVSIFLADTLAGLGTATAHAIPFRYALSLGAIMARVRGMNRTTGGIDRVEGVPDSSLTLRLPIDAVTRGLTTKLRNGTRQFVRFEAVGPNIETGNDYRLRIDTECLVSAEPGEQGDEGGAFAQDIPFTLAGPGLHLVELTNTQATY